MNLREHLSPSQLKAYLQGWVDEPTSDSIERHLAECPECEETLVLLENDSDTLVQHLRQEPPSWDGSDNVGRPNAIQLPKRLGAYELQRAIGHGGMGAVYQARHVQLDKSFAIKLVHLPERLGNQVSARFEREVRAAGGLDHPAIVAATDAGHHDQTHFLVMELIDGNDLGKIARAFSPLAVNDACEIIRQVADGLAHAHAGGVVHRDVKPSNVMLSRAGKVKILDFGLARLSKWDDDAVELTTVGQLMGTLDYMAPEQAERPEAVDYRADLYALGATLFRLLCGRSPLSATPDLSPLAKLRLLANHAPPRVDTLRPDLPTGLVDLIRQMLASDPNDRPASASHVSEALMPFCEGHDLARLGGKEIDEVTDRDETRELRTVNRPPVFATHSDGNKVPHLRWIALAMLPLLVMAGITMSVLIPQGQLVIESDAAVTVNVLRGGKTYDSLHVEPGTNATKLYAGTYEITIDDASDSFSLDKDIIQMERGDVVVARIQLQGSESEPLHVPLDSPASNNLTALPTSSQLLQSGDRIEVVVNADDQLNTGTTVLGDDTIKLRLVGVVSTDGLTLVELETILNRNYSKWYDDPGVELFYDVTYLPGVASTQNSNRSQSQRLDLKVSNLGNATEVDEPLYEGKPLSQWIELLRRETSHEGFEKAVSAVASMANASNRDQLLQIVKHLLEREAERLMASEDLYARSKSKQLYKLLASIVPDQEYADFILDRLKTSPPPIRYQTIRDGVNGSMAWTDFQPPNWNPIRQWIESEVFQGTENETLVDLSGFLYLNWHRQTGQPDEAAIRALANCSRLSDDFWVKAIYQTPHAVLVQACMQRIETCLTDADSTDEDVVVATALYRVIASRPVSPYPEFKDRKSLVESLGKRIQALCRGQSVSYPIVDPQRRAQIDYRLVRTFPGSSPHDWHIERVKLSAFDDGRNETCALFEMLDFITLMGGQSFITSELQELKSMTKSGHERALQFLADYGLRSIELRWPAMSMDQSSLRQLGKGIPASEFHPKDWFDVFAYERAVRMLAETGRGESPK